MTVHIRVRRRVLAHLLPPLLLVIAHVASASVARAQAPAVDPAREPASTTTMLGHRLLERIARDSSATVAVVYRPLGARRGAARLAIAPDSSFHAASTMKVAVMIELFRRVDAGGLAIDQPLLLVNDFTSIADGSRYALLAADEDGDTTLYRRVGTRVPLAELLDAMITQSSNLATNALLALLGPAEITRTAGSLGAGGMRVLRGVQDIPAYERGMSNTTTAAALAALMAAIEEGRAASPASTRVMREGLLRQAFIDEIPAGLPAGVRVAHKTGTITAHSHDAAIVYPREGDSAPPYVLVVMTRGIADQARASRLIADLSRLVWTHHVAAGSAAPESGR